MKQNDLSLNNKKIITLIGMMGTGKSKFGRLVAEKLNYEFYDTDTLIENSQKNTIRTIFNENGEDYFRKIEKNTIEKLIINTIKHEEKAVLSLGGGAFDNEDTRGILLSCTHVIWLNTPIDTLIKRVGDGSKRPMIKGDIKTSINNLLSKRIKFYSLCHNQIDTDGLNQNQILDKIIMTISC